MDNKYFTYFRRRDHWREQFLQKWMWCRRAFRSSSSSENEWTLHLCVALTGPFQLIIIDSNLFAIFLSFGERNKICWLKVWLYNVYFYFNSAVIIYFCKLIILSYHVLYYHSVQVNFPADFLSLQAFIESNDELQQTIRREEMELLISSSNEADYLYQCEELDASIRIFILTGWSWLIVLFPLQIELSYHATLGTTKGVELFKFVNHDRPKQRSKS